MDANTPTAFSPQTQSRGKPSRLVLAVAAVLATVLLGLFFGSVGHSQTPDNEGPILLAVGGPGCEAHPDEAVPSPGPPHPRISGLERCISPGSSDAFTLGGHNLVSSGQYSMELVLTTEDSGALGFDSSCSGTTKTYTFTGALPTVTHSPTLYGCGGDAAFGVLHAELFDAGAEVLRTGDYLVFVVPLPSPDRDVTGEDHIPPDPPIPPSP